MLGHTEALWVIRSLGSQTREIRPELRRSLYAQLDPLTRLWARRQASDLLAPVALRSAHADDEAHVHRTAYLEARGVPVDSDDPALIRAQFETVTDGLPQAPPRRYRWLPAATLCGALLGVAGYLGFAGRGHWFDLGAQSAHAFVLGGRPERGDETVRSLYKDRLQEFAQALNHAYATAEEPEAAALDEVAARQADALSDLDTALGADARSFLHAVLAQSKALAQQRAPVGYDSFFRSVNAYNDAVFRAGVGQYLDVQPRWDARAQRYRVYMSTFTIEHVALFRAGTQRVRSLWLSRRDGAGFNRSVLGFTRPQIDDALVLLEPVDTWLVSGVLGTLSEQPTLPLFDADQPVLAFDEMKRLTAIAAGEVARQARSLVTAPAQLDRIGRLLHEREALFQDWQERFRGTLKVREPRSYDFDLQRYAGLEPAVMAYEWRRLHTLQTELRALEPTHQELRLAVLSAVQLHELQHRLDFDAAQAMPVAPWLVERLGTPLVDGRVNEGLLHANAELSAYLAELARSPGMNKIALSMLAEHLFKPNSWGSSECYAALAIFEGLAPPSLAGALPLVAEGKVRTASVARVMESLLARSDAALSRDASTLWTHWYRRKLEPIEPWTSDAEGAHAN